MKSKICLTACIISVLAVGLCGLTALGQEASIFEELPESFFFSSGAGAWSTLLQVKEDGYFTGEYHDSEMGSTGEGYPHGSVYICKFEGKFSQPVKLDDCTYSMKLETLETEGSVGESYIEDSIRYVYSEPYGMNGGEEFMLYLPGCRIEDLPEPFVSWSHVLWENPDAEIMTCYGIYNVNAETGFVGYRDIESTEEYIIPDSSSGYLNESDIVSMDKGEIQQAINEIYARHGRTFTYPKVDEYFRAKSWYQPISGKTDEQIVSEFNEYEKYNVNLMAKYL